MSRGNLLYDRPDLTQRFGKLALYVSGSLLVASPDAAYKGRLQIHNAIGDCWAELINGELPPGSSITVDNLRHEVVVAWPAYSEAAVPVVNGDFEADDTSWLRDAGWTIEAKGARPDDTSGTNAAAFRGSGEAFIEAATFYPMTGVQQSINYGVKIQQGGSSSGNVRAAAALRYYDAEHKLIATDMGNVVSSGSDGEWKASGGTSLKPGAAAWVRPAVWGLRKRQSRPLYADDFTWNLKGVAVGVHSPTTYPIAIRVHDAGGRVADWGGTVDVRSGSYAVYFRKTTTTTNFIRNARSAVFGATSKWTVEGVFTGMVETPSGAWAVGGIRDLFCARNQNIRGAFLTLLQTSPTGAVPRIGQAIFSFTTFNSGVFGSGERNLSSSIPVQIDADNHFAVTRSAGGLYRLWVNGQLAASLTDTSNIWEPDVLGVDVGTRYGDSPTEPRGVRWFALTQGAEKYTANFTPPASFDEVSGFTCGFSAVGPEGSTSYPDPTGNVWTPVADAPPVIFIDG